MTRSCFEIASNVRPPASPDRLARRVGCVAIRFTMLTYYCVRLRIAPLSNRIDALPLNAIYQFETASISFSRKARKRILPIKSGFNSFNARTSLREKILGQFI